MSFHNLASMTGKSASLTPTLKPRLRVIWGKNIALGPGKAELLARVGETGSISEAARQMRMSYNRAWLHIQDINRGFKSPLVVSLRGGKAGGGAELTETGRRVLKLYQQMELASLRAVQADWRSLQKFLRS
jgi:molybdate transport system regulatory protein